jgi:hypothetical protein
MKTACIWGFHEETRKLIIPSDAQEVWTLNNAYKYDDLPANITRWYEMHDDWQLYSDTQDDKHDDFLRSEHPFDIVMMRDRSADYPSCIVYPLKDAIAAGRRYFTNTIAYMIAHAILDGYERIELYGVDMASTTEYAYQKACTEYWIGIAEGRGIEVYAPEISELCNAPLYGYDTDAHNVGIDAIRAQAEHYTGDEYMVHGARLACDTILELAINGRVSRQTIERERYKSEVSMNKALSDANYWAGYCGALSDVGKSDYEARYNIKKVVENRTAATIWNGAIAAYNNMMALIDMRKVNYNLASRYTVNNPRDA